MKVGAKQAGGAGTADGWAGGIVRWWREVRVRQERRGTAPRELRLRETLALTAKQRLVLVQCGEERFLVGTGQDGVPSIVRLSAGAPAGGAESADWERAAGRDRR